MESGQSEKRDVHLEAIFSLETQCLPSLHFVANLIIVDPA